MHRHAISHNRERHCSRLAVERLGPVVEALDPRIRNGGIGTDLDQHRGIRGEQRTEEDFVLDDGVRVEGGLSLGRVVADNAAGGSAGGGGEAIPVLHLVAGDVEGVALVFGDVVGEEVTQALVRHIVDVDVGTGGNLRVRVDRADVVGFSKIVPSHYSASNG